ncbi:Lrp/AsnC family transcriptional regulator [Isoptericola cucumis]|uniref:Transcriptional regulator, AsnC family protein n=1 Tax=Isoptericola cucumis TaxID=1776856 RepID=A0ABQ2B3P8_9MICO|nr:Lrp/AsnC family transcriptional regulator [Isoptericola cucumis]GGI07246.1 putative transcriptional regulator, AsnC family protein [Isoptericola cucumis]
MPTRGSANPVPGQPRPKDLRHDRSWGLDRRAGTSERLDDVDQRLLTALAEDARIPNNALAAKAGIAPSTCLTRVQRLRERGVIRGFHADVDPARAGHPLQAMIAVQMRGTARTRLSAYLQRLAELPGVLNVFLLGGAHDFFVHVAAADSDALNDFVIEHLSTDPDVALTETNLIFQHARAGWY